MSCCVSGIAMAVEVLPGDAEALEQRLGPAHEQPP
jgi:hypothetical protein